MCLLAIYISTLVKYLFVLSLIFYCFFFLFLLLRFDSSIILDNLDTFNQVCGLQITFSQIVVCVFILFTWSFPKKRIFFQYSKGCATSSCSLLFQMRNLLAFELVFSLGNVLFLYGCFQEFFCLYSSEVSLQRVLACISLGLYCLEFAQLVESIGLHLSPNFKNF